MLTIGRAFYDLKDTLRTLYDDREAAAIAHEMLNYITGLDKSRRLLHKDDTLTSEQQARYNIAKTDLISGKPLQYVTGVAWFLGREFMVNNAVLIPRPETEELVQWMISDFGNKENQKILDIGTGSGCMPISLKLALPQADIMACDISLEALDVAKANAERLGADVKLLQLDFLNEEQREELGAFNIIVSNPPYIPELEQERIHTNVKDHEPHIALFVPDNDPLIFYKAIASFATDHLTAKGYIYCELDAGHAQATKELFVNQGYADVELKEDMHGNLRMLRVMKN